MNELEKRLDSLLSKVNNEGNTDTLGETGWNKINNLSHKLRILLIEIEGLLVSVEPIINGPLKELFIYSDGVKLIWKENIEGAKTYDFTMESLMYNFLSIKSLYDGLLEALGVYEKRVFD